MTTTYDPITNQKIINQAACTEEQRQEAGARNPTSTVTSYVVNRDECNCTMLDAGTGAQAVSAGAPAHLQGIMIHTALAGTLTITGMTNVSDSATDFVLPIGTVAGFYDFKGARCETALSVTKSSASDDGAIAVMWRPI